MKPGGDLGGHLGIDDGSLDAVMTEQIFFNPDTCVMISYSARKANPRLRMGTVPGTVLKGSS